jgi:mannose-6-phosphate isomerase-like protein (cupin superfamily)
MNSAATPTMRKPSESKGIPPIKGYAGNIELETWENSSFRKVLFTAPHCQLVVMSIPPGGDIGLEVHDVDQFLRIETGEGTAILGHDEHELRYGSAVIVPAGTPHNIVNTGMSPLKLYTIYAPAHHAPGTEHLTKEDAVKSEAKEKSYLHTNITAQ